MRLVQGSRRNGTPGCRDIGNSMTKLLLAVLMASASGAAFAGGQYGKQLDDSQRQYDKQREEARLQIEKQREESRRQYEQQRADNQRQLERQQEDARRAEEQRKNSQPWGTPPPSPYR